MKVQVLKRALLIGVLVLAFLPLAKKFFPKEIKPLRGAVILAIKPEFNLSSWKTGQFQTEYENYINDNIGFRSLLVRFRNQLLYSLYDKVNAHGVLRGKENYMFEKAYIRAYNGDDFIGADSVRMKVEQINFLQDTLQKLGKSLIVCLAPGKGSFYPDFFPEEYKQCPTEQTNYKYYSRYLKEAGVNTIDFNKWFLEMKDTCSCMLYPRYGIHWSDYGMFLATDSLIRFTEQIHGIELPHLNLYNFQRKKGISDGDYDIAIGMNLLFQLPTEAMCYPEYKWEKSEISVQPKVIVIADSFYWAMYSIGLTHSCFTPGGFWYYNRTIYSPNNKNNVAVKDVKIEEKIAETDVFILMGTEANLSRFPYGFVNNVYAYFSK